MAMESSKVIADVVEVQEFPYLSQRYSVRGVPMTVINDEVQFSGAVPEIVLMDRVLKALGELDVEDEDEAQETTGETSAV